MLRFVDQSQICLRGVGKNHRCIWLAVRGRTGDSNPPPLSIMYILGSQGPAPMAITMGRPLITGPARHVT
jgi:hypothetical protein